MSSTNIHRIAIIGAGAAGCFAAANIPSRDGLEVVIFEKGAKPMQKIKVSGGGRCNVTHACFDIPELIRRYPRGQSFLKKSLYHFGPRETIDWFSARGVVIKQEPDGRMFPDTDDAQTIIDAIWTALMRNGAQVRFRKGLQSAHKLDDGCFRLLLDDGSEYVANQVLLATGSILKPDSFAWVNDLGHDIIPPAPSLFTFNLPGQSITQLMGVSIPQVTVRVSGTKFLQEGPLLITHWGLSGPAVLRTSAWAARWLQGQQYQFQVTINWLHNKKEQALRDDLQVIRRQQGSVLVQHKNPFDLPRRLWDFLLERAGITNDIRWGELPAAAQNKLVQILVQDQYAVSGKTTFKEEFVTCGGIALQGIQSQTMESRSAPGLYFGGECMDIDGITGGYNFTHAWNSGWLAAKAILARFEAGKGG